MVSIAEKLVNATVGVAGLGGLGSVVAECLLRSGIGKLIIADFDAVDKSNLNRQRYFADQVGKLKVEAAKENLLRINPKAVIESYNQKITAENAPRIFAEATVVAECLDEAEQKQMLVETILTKTDKAVVSASGIAGFGDSNSIETRRMSDKLIVCGDFESGIDNNKIVTAGRVGIVACHQANAIVELIVYP
ncbi:MAG: sulfur carrier protein ThiS adenylyltransferase ThiF [Planctomycetes bacterium]|nr:sulfur carrier protein ThiS adenylyltransferase ThiF [Planctomycetota bacterium]